MLLKCVLRIVFWTRGLSLNCLSISSFNLEFVFLFNLNDALLYDVGHNIMIKNHSYSKRGNLLPTLHGLLFPISNKASFICTILQTE